MNTVFLADKSALTRGHLPEVDALLSLLAVEGSLASCHLVALEVLYSARNSADYAQLRQDIGSLPWLPVNEAVMDRALEVQGLLALRGQHRLPLPDLMIAATAERHGATVLHYDRDFDLIAAVTGQPTRWVVPRGSI